MATDASKDALLEKIASIIERVGHDPEVAHSLIDKALYEFVDDPRLTKLLEGVTMWYA